MGRFDGRTFSATSGASADCPRTFVCENRCIAQEPNTADSSRSPDSQPASLSAPRTASAVSSLCVFSANRPNGVMKAPTTYTSELPMLGFLHTVRPVSQTQNLYIRGDHQPVTQELTVSDLPVHGSLPKELCGLFARNSP